VGELVTRITYADALSEEEANDLIKWNEEAARLTAEAFTKVYLVNMIPMCMSILMPTKPLAHLISSQIYPCLGARRRVPTVSYAGQGPISHNSQWSLGQCSQGYRELISFWDN
jgi:hypothetical protein